MDNADRYALATVSVSRAGDAGDAGGAQGAGGARRGVRFASKHFQCEVSEAAAPGTLLATLHTDPPSHHVRTYDIHALCPITNTHLT